jgi:hypothetical protein
VLRRAEHEPHRARKFRQAAIAYLHYAVLYELGVYALYEQGMFPASRGSPTVWLVFGVVIAGLVVWGLWWWQNRWFARVVWVVMSLRLPALMAGAFLGTATTVAPGFYLAAGIVVIAAMWMIARAAWDV